MHTPSTAGGSGGAAGGVPSAQPASAERGGGAASPAGAAHHHHHQYGRVIELLQEPLLGGDNDVAVVKILSAPTCMPPDETIGVR